MKLLVITVNVAHQGGDRPEKMVINPHYIKRIYQDYKETIIEMTDNKAYRTSIGMDELIKKIEEL